MTGASGRGNAWFHGKAGTRGQDASTTASSAADAIAWYVTPRRRRAASDLRPIAGDLVLYMLAGWRS